MTFITPVDASLALSFYRSASPKQRLAVLWDVGSHETAFAHYVGNARVSTAAYINDAPCAIAWAAPLSKDALELHFFYCGTSHMKPLLPHIATRFLASLPACFKKLYCLVPGHFAGCARLLHQLDFTSTETLRLPVRGRCRNAALYLKELQ